MNSQETRKVKASSASTTRFMPARNAAIERQHPAGRFLVRAIADGKQARAGAAEVDHGEKERGERIDAEMGADPWQSEGQPAATLPRRRRRDT